MPVGKTCSKCRAQKPGSDFFRDKSKPDGLYSQVHGVLRRSLPAAVPEVACRDNHAIWYLVRITASHRKRLSRQSRRAQCKACAAGEERRRLEQREAMATLANGLAAPQEKRCSRCGQDKPAAAFCRNKRSADGLYSQCRTCVSAKVQALCQLPLSHLCIHAHTDPCRAATQARLPAPVKRATLGMHREKNGHCWHPARLAWGGKGIAGCAQLIRNCTTDIFWGHGCMHDKETSDAPGGAPWTRLCMQCGAGAAGCDRRTSGGCRTRTGAWRWWPQSRSRRHRSSAAAAGSTRAPTTSTRTPPSPMVCRRVFLPPVQPAGPARVAAACAAPPAALTYLHMPCSSTPK